MISGVLGLRMHLLLSWCGIHRRGIVLAVLLLATAALSGVYLHRSAPSVNRVFKIGFQNSPPHHFPDAHGNPSGSAVDVIEQAARRRSLRLQWIYSPEGPDAALTSGKIDLWPIMGDLPERRRKVYISAPWEKMTYVVLTPEFMRATDLSDLAGRIMAVSHMGLDVKIAKRYLTRTQIRTVETVADVIKAVCNGPASSGLLSENTFLEARPAECARAPLHVIPVNEATFWFGVGANKDRSDARHAADLLRDEIGHMATDGSLVAIDFRWHTNLNTEAGTIFQYGSARSNAMVLLMALSIFTLAVGIMGWLIARLRVARRQAEAARQQATAATKAKSEFLANMSHEIRTPMNGIIGLTELALDTPLNADQRDCLSGVKNSADALLTILNDILDFSKIEAGKLSLDHREFNLHQVMGETMGTLALRAQQKGIELLCRIAPDVPEIIVGDPVRLRQILWNLAGNSIKFTERGEVLVDVEAVSGQGDEFLLRCRVVDTGIGIPKNKIDAIFESFTQADGSITRRYGGTGLGLAIVSRLAHLMGGSVSVQSEENRGSTFEVTARFRKTAASELRTPLTAGLAGLPVLVVDDNATNRRILEEYLRSWEMRPVAAAGGEEAVARISECGDENPFALILLDGHMPGMDGFAVAEWMKNHATLSGVPVMMISSADQPERTTRCKALGIASYLVKPVRKPELLHAIREVLGHGSGEHAIEPHPHDVSPQRRASRVLLAEDNLVNQRLMIRVLQQHGYTVLIANTGREALDALETERFDIVLMDVHMPEMDGLDASRLIRERERASGNHIPIIAMTACAMSGDRERCLEAGADDYLSKPVSIAAMLEMIDRYAGHCMAV